MATPASRNAGLEAPTLFDVSYVTAVLSGGGSGLGLMITQVYEYCLHIRNCDNRWLTIGLVDSCSEWRKGLRSGTSRGGDANGHGSV